MNSPGLFSGFPTQIGGVIHQESTLDKEVRGFWEDCLGGLVGDVAVASAEDFKELWVCKIVI